MRDSVTGRARGFGFVEMVTDEDAQKAIAQFHQYALEGRALVVNEARPKTPGGGGRSFAGAGRSDYGDGGTDRAASRAGSRPAPSAAAVLPPGRHQPIPAQLPRARSRLVPACSSANATTVRSAQ